MNFNNLDGKRIKLKKITALHDTEAIQQKFKLSL